MGSLPFARENEAKVWGVDAALRKPDASEEAGGGQLLKFICHRTVRVAADRGPLCSRFSLMCVGNSKKQRWRDSFDTAIGDTYEIATRYFSYLSYV
jgi:hypothetical protein